MRDQTIPVPMRPNPVAVFLRRPVVQAFFHDPITVFSATFVSLVVLAAIFAPFVTPYDHKEQHLEVRHLPPFSTGTVVTNYDAKPYPTEDRFFILGTDHLGRDYFSRLVYGGRISLAVGVLDALARNLEILGLDLYADELAAQLGAGYASGAAAHEGVEDGI